MLSNLSRQSDLDKVDVENELKFNNRICRINRSNGAR